MSAPATPPPRKPPPSPILLRVVGGLLAGVGLVMAFAGECVVRSGNSGGKSAATIWSGWALAVLAPFAGSLYCFLRAARVARRARMRD